jgi:hypothetical protein
MARRPLGAISALLWQQSAGGDAAWNERYFYWTWGKCLFIVLDTYSFASGTDKLGAIQRAWCEAVLSGHADYPFKFVFHHDSLDEDDPDHSSGHTVASGYTVSNPWLLDLIDLYGVQIFGHGHYAGWRHAQGSEGAHYLCGNFGAAVGGGGTDDWYGEYRYWRVRVGMQWDGAEYVANPDCMSLALVDPTTEFAVGGTEVGYFNVFSTDNPSELATTTTTTTTATTTTSPLRRRAPADARWERSGLDILVRPMRG